MLNNVVDFDLLLHFSYNLFCRQVIFSQKYVADLVYIVDVSLAGFSTLSAHLLGRKLHYTHINNENFKMSRFSIEVPEKEIVNITLPALYNHSNCSVGH